MLTLTSPVETWAHRLPVAVKLGALALSTVVLFQLNSPAPLGLAAFGTGLLIATGGAQFAKTSARMLAGLWPFVVIVGLWHLVTSDLMGGVVILLRMFTAIALANFVTMTTPLSALLDLFQRALAPLRRLGLNPAALSMAMALVIRFIPVMLHRWAQLAEAHSARSTARAGWRLLLPATLAALDDAEQVAQALRARGGMS